MTTEMLLVWLPSLLISLLSISVFVYLGYRNREKIDNLTEQARDYSLQRVETFLQREAQATRLRIKHSHANVDSVNPIDQLRLIWLESELTALVDQGKRRSNYDLLVHGVQPIARMLNRAVAPKSTATEQIQKARNTLTSQNEAITQYRQKMTTIDKEPEQPPSDAFNDMLGSVEQNTAALLATISRLESELANVQTKFDVSEQQTRALTSTSKSESREALIISSPSKPDEHTRAAHDLLRETEQAYQQSVSEMNRMRDINSQQRLLILQLDKELELVRKDTAQHEISSDVLDKLKLQLRDYETCTVILEKEGDTLRDKIDALKKMISMEANGAAIEIIAAASPVHHSPKDQLDMLELIGEIIGADSAHSIVTRTIEWLKRQQLSAVIFVRGEAEQIWGSSEGGVDSHSKQLMQSIVALPDKPRLDIDEGILLMYPIFRVLVYQTSRLGENDGELLQRLQLVAKIVDRWLLLMQNQQLAQRSADLGDLKTQLSGLLAQYNYISKEHQRVGEKFRKELNGFFAAMGISEIQQQMVTTLLDDFDAQLEIIGKASKLIYTRMKALAEDMEQRETAY